MRVTAGVTACGQRRPVSSTRSLMQVSSGRQEDPDPQQPDSARRMSGRQEGLKRHQQQRWAEATSTAKQGQVLTRNDPYRTVNQFCEWSRHQIPIGADPHYDISVLITKERLGPSGYAPITGLCNPVRSCAAVREEGFSTGFIIAHEMAHVFGLFHDGHGNNCHGRQYKNAMMAPLVESKLNQFWWSSCSSRRMKEMVRSITTRVICCGAAPPPIVICAELKEDHPCLALLVDIIGPAYDGEKCEGVDSAWETCVNETCESYKDNRDGECAVWDSLQIRYGTHKWEPFESHDAPSMCKQTCQSSYNGEVVTIDVHVSDGTPCTYTGNNSNICLDGRCLSVGCDGKINSTKNEDMCGVCAGDSTTCKVVEGTMARLPNSGTGYLNVVTLPKGSRHIHIEETIRFPKIYDLDLDFIEEEKKEGRRSEFWQYIAGEKEAEVESLVDAESEKGGVERQNSEPTYRRGDYLNENIYGNE
ncbi:A disintegrin and metalloproteinase with thrombospondin motifs 3 [Elysia marginata]|uniref:A disintegrin and metalloproteinase with thrombospondin motifs 3 n=1 Tax=Elysia marginata TaxID=1093978 RepID=A0AAV4EJB6_9GAST|nr:A disintegrin and metalloproteinase with thrombospondin motifs 3 [Elysia marginata]